jgi:hypothetical protein
MKTIFHTGSDPIKVLHNLQRLFGTNNAILAGGALRDDYMDKSDEISDYDIFIHTNNNLLHPKNTLIDEYVKNRKSFEDYIIKRVFPHCSNFDQLFDSTYMTCEDQLDCCGDIKPGPNSQVLGVWEIDDHNDNVYQLVFTKLNPVDHINKYFDIGFCKVYCDGTKIRYTTDFLHDAKNRQLTIVGDDMTADQVEYTINHHCDKIQWKYGNSFRIVVPERYQKFVEGQGFPTR